MLRAAKFTLRLFLYPNPYSKMNRGFNRQAPDWQKLYSKAHQARSKGDKRIAASTVHQLLRQPEAQRPEIYLEAADIFLANYERIAARDAVLKASEFNNLNLRGLVLSATYLFRCGYFKDEYEYLRRVMTRTSHDVLSTCLAETCERTGRIDEAMALLEEVRDSIPRADLLRGFLCKRQGDVDKAFEYFQKAAKGQDKQTAFHAGLELAKCHEKLEDYQSAWRVMKETREEHFPNNNEAKALDKEYLNKINLALKDAELWNSHDSFQTRPKDDHSPILVCGHPRSGTSVVTVALEKSLNRVQFDEPDAFWLSMYRARLDETPITRLKNESVRQKLRDGYFQCLSEIQPDSDLTWPLIDKNPVLELSAFRWMAAFPSSTIINVSRHPLDTMTSCLFTYMGANAYSLQYYTPERLAVSLKHSQQLRELMRTHFPENYVELDYETFVSGGSLPLDKLPSPVPGGIAPDLQLYSPNYGSAREAISKSSIHRFEKYANYMPKEILHGLA